MVKCNYSEKLNFLQAQTCNVHLCHHLAMGENHFEPHPLKTENQQYGLRVPLQMQSLLHFQPLVHNSTLAEPTHSHPFIFRLRYRSYKILHLPDTLNPLEATPYAGVRISKLGCKQQSQGIKILIQHNQQRKGRTKPNSSIVTYSQCYFRRM